jgi:hypothetical protein
VGTPQVNALFQTRPDVEANRVCGEIREYGGAAINAAT